MTSEGWQCAPCSVGLKLGPLLVLQRTMPLSHQQGLWAGPLAKHANGSAVLPRVSVPQHSP